MIARELAGCVLPHEEGGFWVIHRNTPKLIQWELPGGKKEFSETLPEAAIREAQEELGVRVSLSRKLDDFWFDSWHYTRYLGAIAEGVPTPMEAMHDAVERYDPWNPNIAWEELSINMRHLSAAIVSRAVLL